MNHIIVKLQKKLHDRKPRMTSLGTHYTEQGDGKSSQCSFGGKFSAFLRTTY
jgi:hypothetical protein